MKLLISFAWLSPKDACQIQTFFLWVAASVADAVNSNGIKTLLASGLSRFFIKGILVFSSGPKILPKNSPDFTILCKWVFDNFILAEEFFANALESFETRVLVNNKLWGELFSSWELATTFNERLKVTSMLLFINMWMRQFYV